MWKGQLRLISSDRALEISAKALIISASKIGGRGAFHAPNKNSGMKFRQFLVPNGTAHSGCTDPTQANGRLVIVLVVVVVSRMQKSGTGDNN